ncbi:hypothetical protein [Haloferax sp. DFSO60]|uniref:hypothetical protein n=1 Tax=Haloferax sp. DFSO60 TaxID=3388652 RepID=UPI00397CDC9C
MVVDSLSDGKRIAQLLASELTGHEEAFARLEIVDSDPDVEPTDDGTFAYGVDFDDERVADVFVQPDRARVEFRSKPDLTAETASEADLRVRPKAVRPPRTLVFLEDGAQVKWVLPTFRSLVSALEAEQ